MISLGTFRFCMFYYTHMDTRTCMCNVLHVTCGNLEGVCGSLEVYTRISVKDALVYMETFLLFVSDISILGNFPYSQNSLFQMPLQPLSLRVR